MRTRSVVVGLGVSVLLAGCASRHARPVLPDAVSPSVSEASADPVFSSEAWTLHGVEGKLLRTPSYRIFTTESNPLVSRRIPVFLEMAMAQYVSVFGPLQRPTQPMETFILATRSQWAALTQRMMGRDAEVYLRIRAGGFAHDGRALLFNIGSRGTFATASHEGWHQFTQRTFKHPLPIWLEEGIATYMEGYRWDPQRPERPLFLAWSNVERFDRLRDVMSSGRQFDLGTLLSERPQDLLTSTSNERALDYYAQVWALTHFLLEGEGGRHRSALADLMADASAGRLVQRVRARARSDDALDYLRRRAGAAVFTAYFDDDLAGATERYDEFLREIVDVGGRDAIVAGRSPITP